MSWIFIARLFLQKEPFYGAFYDKIDNGRMRDWPTHPNISICWYLNDYVNLKIAVNHVLTTFNKFGKIDVSSVFRAFLGYFFQ